MIRAKEITCRNNLKQLGIAELLYVDEYNGRFFPYSGGTWIPQIRPVYSQVDSVVLCPIAPPQNPQPGAATDGAWNFAWFNPVNPPNTNINGSYTFNGWLYNGNWTFAGVGPPSDGFQQQSGVKFPAATPVFGDGVWVDSWPFENDLTDNGNFQVGAITTSGVAADQAGGPEGLQRYLIARHGPHRVSTPPVSANNKDLWPGGINMVFFDGHVEDVSLNDLWNLYWHLNWSFPAKGL
jgi:prepilin-type processing-associated H-X9-DG protein